ncbi:MAG: RNA 2',3'-cyclic phosphodiesterase [Patescibacteria group bacterium]|nr:RNA 2',3'-cyclic phosphodiesterase [Patescibacteria group bacterium]
MRLFVAIDLPAEIKDSLWQQLAYLRDCLEFARFVEKENLHLTLAFLGNQPEKSLNLIKEAIKDTALNFTSQKLVIDKISLGPSELKPRMIWLGFDKASQGYLESLANHLRKNLKKAALDFDEKDFSSHITLARFDNRWQLKFQKKLSLSEKNREIKRIKEDFSPFKLEFWVEKITLFESNLTPTGPLYKKIFEFELKK